MPKYYIKCDSCINKRVVWLGSNNQWVDLQCNAIVFDNLEGAKVALASFFGSAYTSQYSSYYSIVEEKVTFDVVFKGNQLISVRLNELASKVWFYTFDHIAEEIRKIAKEIKQ